MTNNKREILLTKDGHDELQEEHKKLTEVERPQVMKEIQDARAMGDLSENGMYSAAREKQSFLEGRIREIEDILKNAKVADKKGKSEVGLGSKVTIEAQKKEVEYHIVGAEEVDFQANKISHESPLGEALMGKKVGEMISVKAPAGEIEYKIVNVK